MEILSAKLTDVRHSVTLANGSRIELGETPAVVTMSRDEGMTFMNIVFLVNQLVRTDIPDGLQITHWNREVDGLIINSYHVPVVTTGGKVQIDFPRVTDR